MANPDPDSCSRCSWSSKFVPACRSWMLMWTWCPSLPFWWCFMNGYFHDFQVSSVNMMIPLFLYDDDWSSFWCKSCIWSQLLKHNFDVSASNILWMKAALFHFDGECWYKFYEWKAALFNIYVKCWLRLFHVYVECYKVFDRNAHWLMYVCFAGESQNKWWCHDIYILSLIHIWRCRRIERCRSRWSPYH